MFPDCESCSTLGADNVVEKQSSGDVAGRGDRPVAGMSADLFLSHPGAGVRAVG